MTLSEIYFQYQRFARSLITKEFVDQGHYLTGRSIDELSFEIEGDTLFITSTDYFVIVNDGIPASRITWSMYPKLIEYFRLRQNPEPEKAAQQTIAKWMKEGMPTEGSEVYSKTGKRTHFIEDAIDKNDARLDEYFFSLTDQMVEDLFNKLP